MSEQQPANNYFVAEVRCDKDGEVHKFCSGEIKAEDAERVASALVEMAMAIRSEARREIFLL